MRFMMIIKANDKTEAGVLPTAHDFEVMGKYNEELVKAGVMLAGEGLHASAKGARVKASGGRKSVVDGPFSEAKELIAGFWIIQAKSLAEAVEWAKRCPLDDGNELEIRQIFEAEDFGPALTPELRKAEEDLAKQAAANAAKPA